MTDASTGLPIEGATVDIETASNDNDPTYTTSANGTTPVFNVSKKNYFTVTVSAPGYSNNGSYYFDSNEWIEDSYELTPTTST